jgi:hypothetical protein
MTDNDKPAVGEALDAEQLNAIGGGACTVGELLKLSNELRSAYENLIEFTSYVIERVGGAPPP